MTGKEMLTALKEVTGTTNFSNISDSRYYSWLTRSHKFIANKITSQIDSKYLYSIVHTNSVARQYKYHDLPVKVIDTIFVKYNEEDEYIKTRMVDISEMNKSVEWYSKHQPKDYPLSFITDDIVMIFPMPSKNVTNGIYITGKKEVGDITSTTTSADVFNGHNIDHEVIIDGAEQYVYKELQEFQKEQIAKDNFYNKGRLKQPGSLDTLISDLSYRGSQPIYYEEDTGSLAQFL